MDLNIKVASYGILKRFDNFDAHWELRFTEIESARKQRDFAVDAHVNAIKQYYASQYDAAPGSNNWGGHFDQRIDDLEEHVNNLELLLLSEIQSSGTIGWWLWSLPLCRSTNWRPGVKAIIDNIGVEVGKLSKH